MAIDLTNQHWLETYKSLISFSVEGFKFSAIANGGAAVALLAYLGNVSAKGSVTPDMRFPMAAFLAGIFTCGFVFLFAYFTQLKLLNEIGRDERPAVPHGWLLWTTIFLFACSLAAFGVGSWQAVVRFR